MHAPRRPATCKDTLRAMLREIRLAWREAVGDAPAGAEPARVTYGGVIVALLVAGVALAVWGLVDDTANFAGNILAEFSGVLIGAVVAVTLLERVLAQQRRAQWDTVRGEIRTAIVEQVLAMATDFAQQTGGGRSFLVAAAPLGAVPDAAVAAALDELADEVGAWVGELARDLDVDIASSTRLFTAVEPSFAPVRDLLVTRIIVLDADTELVRRLMHLERVEREWRRLIRQAAVNEPVEAAAWAAAVRTLRAGIAAYRYFLEHD